MPPPPPDAEAHSGSALAAAAAGLDRLRARGVHQHDPLRFFYAEALARRAAAQSAPVQARLQPRLEQALDELARRHEARPAGATPAHRPAEPSSATLGTTLSTTPGTTVSSPLGALLQRLNRQPDAAAAHTDARLPANDAPAELKALSQFRSTWAGLSVDRQLSQSLAQAPENPGPLNSHRLVLRTLQTLQSLSPAYLQRFLAHADALLWLEQLSAAQATAPGPAPRRERKPTKPPAKPATQPKPAPARTRAR